jgi:hypothetical protein
MTSGCPGSSAGRPATPVRRGFRWALPDLASAFRRALPDLASAPKLGKLEPGRPPGSKNRRPATHHDVGETVKGTEPKKGTLRQDRLNNKLSRRL